MNSLISNIRDSIPKVQPVIEQINRTTQLFTALFGDIFAAYERDKEIASAGWYPHRLLPLTEMYSLLQSDPDLLDSWVEKHIREHWMELRNSLENSEGITKLSAGSAETYRQALDAHEADLFRCVPRTLFGEVELVSRIVLTGKPMNNGINAGLKPVLAAIGELPIPALPAELQTSPIYELLSDEVYSDSRRPSLNSKLPNRHDHIHGYSANHATFRDSVNMLLLAESLFSVLNVLNGSISMNESEK